MIKRRPEVNEDEVMKELNERMEASKKLEDEIRSSNEYICWLRDLLEENGNVNDYHIQYREDELDKTTYENIYNLEHFYSIIRNYWEKYRISPTYIDHNIGAHVYRVFYEDFYFEICKVSYLEGYVAVERVKEKQQAINYKDIMEDKEPKEYKEKDEFIKEFRNKIKYYGKKAKKLDIDVEYLKKIIEEEFKS